MMRSRIGMSVGIFLAIVLQSAYNSADAANFTWIGERSSEFFEASNWAPQGVPGTQDTVEIGRGYTVKSSRPIVLAGASIGPESLVNPSGDTTINGPLTLDGATWSSSGSIVVNGALTMSNGAVWSGSGSLTANGESSATAATLSGSGSFTINNVFAAKDCSIVGSGPQVIGREGFLKLGSAGRNGTTIGRTFVNYGHVIWSDGDLVINRAIRNQEGAVLDLQSSGVLSGRAAESLLTNAGTIKRTANEGTSTIDIPYTNTGIMELQTGTLSFTQPFTQASGEVKLDGGNIDAPNGYSVRGGKLKGSGVINGDVVNDGGVVALGHSPGTITINGNYTQASNGTLQMEIGGTSPGTGYDQLVVNGIASLAGTIELLPYNGYVPAAGTNYKLLTYYSVSGSFTTFTGLYPGNQRYYTTTKAPTYFLATAYSDTSLPSVSFSTPVNNGDYNPLTSCSGTASDAGSGLSTVTVMVYRHGNATLPAGYWVGGGTWTPTYSAANERPATGTSSWSLTLNTPTPMTFTLRATATDKAGNQQTTANIIYTNGGGY